MKKEILSINVCYEPPLEPGTYTGRIIAETIGDLAIIPAISKPEKFQIMRIINRHVIQLFTLHHKYIFDTKKEAIRVINRLAKIKWLDWTKFNSMNFDFQRNILNAATDKFFAKVDFKNFLKHAQNAKNLDEFNLYYSKLINN